MKSDDNSQLADLVADLILAKVTEDNAKAKRIKAEEQIAELVETKETGSKTVTVGSHKVTVKRGLIYKVNFEAMKDTADEFGVYAPIKNVTKLSLDIKAYEWQRENCKVAFDAMSEFVNVTPAKTSVALKMVVE